MRLFTWIGASTALLSAAPALAQSAVDPANKNAWAENIGWTNWRDAGAGAQGVRLWPAYLSGWVWGENTGWITVGDGTPGGADYANVNGTDFGVNVDEVTGDLSGYAWGENIGWVNFSGGSLAAPPNPARFDTVDRRLRGYAWGENVGWINLDSPTIFVAFLCPSDYNNDGFVDPLDYNGFINDFEGGSMNADFNGDGFLDPLDYNGFINAFEAGC